VVGPSAALGRPSHLPTRRLGAVTPDVSNGRVGAGTGGSVSSHVPPPGDAELMVHHTGNGVGFQPAPLLFGRSSPSKRAPFNACRVVLQ